MKYIDYVQLSPIEKFTYKLSSFFKAIPGALAGFFSAIGKFLKSFVQGIGNFFKDYATYFFPNAVCESYSSEEFTHLENNDGSIPFLIYSDQGISDKIDMEGCEHLILLNMVFKLIFILLFT